MQAYDLFMLIVIGMATIFGAIKGFAWQVASLASVIVSYIVAYRFRFEVGEMISATPPWNQFLAMLILYVGTSFVIWVGFRLLSGAIDRVRLKEFDRHLGAGFGLAKGMLYCLLITMFAMSLLGPNQQAAICQSRSGYYISAALDRGVGILPKEIHDVVGPYLSGLDEKLNSHDGHDHDEGESERGQFPDLSAGLPAIGDGIRDAFGDQIREQVLDRLPALPTGPGSPPSNFQDSRQVNSVGGADARRFQVQPANGATGASGAVAPPAMPGGYVPPLATSNGNIMPPSSQPSGYPAGSAQQPYQYPNSSPGSNSNTFRPIDRTSQNPGSPAGGYQPR
ncbi:MAG: hypothetical protein Aurels2KO_20530 [Aureliella sp.]